MPRQILVLQRPVFIFIHSRRWSPNASVVLTVKQVSQHSYRTMSYYHKQYDSYLAVNAEEQAKSKNLLFENVDDETDDNFEIGDIIGTGATLDCCVQVQASHFGVYVGDGRVVHKYAKPSTDIGFTLCDSLQIFACEEKKVYKHNVDDLRGKPLPCSEIKQRAIDSLTDHNLKYCIMDRNCFHFAIYCRYGSIGHK